MVDFLKGCERYFGVKGVKFAHTNCFDIACYPAANIIALGKGWRASNPEEQEKKIAHEFLHLVGFEHNQRMRNLGYYSRPERDKLSWRVYRDLKAGTPRFNPAKFGLPKLARR